ncbi:IgGFc-binding protein-like [Branchiostoma lanceolatum]|uniref:IgGFc-binding protein-like n=1 Tax=Branchiostoma lanceolatum TaxID=7740 RepID=UPI0034554972
MYTSFCICIAGSDEDSSSAGSGEDTGSAGSGEGSGSAGSGEGSGSAGSGEDTGSAGSGEKSDSQESGEESSSKESGEESSSKESGEESSSKESGEESSSKESGEESSSKESGEESSSKESGEESSSKESGEESSIKESGEDSSSKESGEESSSKESGEESSSKESGESSSKESGESSSKESEESSSKESGESSSKESGESSSKESGENSGRSSSSVTGCNPGWSHHGSKCYKVASGTFTYAEAEAKCTELNAQPALSKDRATNDFIVRLRNSADSSQPVWIGLKFENAGFFFSQTRRARWIDGELLSDGNFDDWADGEPNDEPGRDADCVRIHQTDGDNPGWSDQWRDYPCDRETLGVICENEARPAGECSADKGVCSASGDPHYTTFDGRRHHFQGYCKYTFAKDCGDNSVFTVETKNVPLTVRPVAVVREVYVKAYGFEIGILQRKKVTVNGKAASLPISVAGGNIEVHLSGRYVRVLLTELCVEVFYDGRHRVKVAVPDSYKDRMCGLCGNYNDNPGDDFIKADGTTAPNWTEFGNSHLTDMSTCPGGDIGPTADAAQPECDDSLNVEVSAADKCGLLKDAGGPFAAGHGQVDPSGAFNDCVFDMCARDGDVEGLCENLEAYADASREAGVDAFAWRTADRCPLECPENSAYSSCTSACPATCTTPDAPDSCSRGCVEGCECAEGFVLSGLDCVPQEQCGCTDDEGRYYVVEESWEEDGKDCACREVNSIVCEDTDACSPSPCDPNAECHDVAAPDTGATCTCNDGYEGDGEADGSGCTAVQCSPLTAPENGALSREDATSYTDEVTVTCNQGYELDGAASVTCQADREWSAPVPTCEPVQCSPPTAPENGALSPEGETSYDYQDEVTFSCNQGYELDGAASVTCQADREWSAPVPTCKPVQCSPPTAPENGALSPEVETSYDYQDEVTFSCNQGYELDGAASVTCQADREWSAPVPACKPVQCSPPTAPENGALSPEGADSYDYQDEVTFSCNQGYELDGASSVTCQADRQWSAPVPTCEPVQCSPPTAPENGALSPEGADSYDYQDEVTFSCNQGYELDGASSVTCQADRQWSAPVPTCEPVQCSPPTAPENGALSPEVETSYDYQDEVTFSCNQGYELDGAASVTCQADREWSAPVPACQPVQCSPPTAPENGALSPEGADSYDYQDEVTFSCNQGYELDGAASVTCQADRQWSAPVPTCEPVQCSPPTAPENGALSPEGADSYDYQDEVTFSCNQGYELDGAASVTCQADREWSAPLPACKRIDRCDPNPCENGGACTDGADSYTCECAAGFEGSQCEINIDDCTPDPCKNGGACTDGDNSFLCECAAGFHGPTCEQVITKSTCVAYGDPHHETLDGASHDFQGTCRYTLTKDLGPDADFNVEVQEVPLPWLTSASVVREVYMEVHGYRIDIRQKKIVSVDEKIRSLPFSLDGGRIQVELSGLFVHIRTDLGVELFYDGKHYVKVVVPSNYQEQVGGLCGNYNGDPSDDFTTRDGAVVSDVNTFGRTWLTDVATCPGGIIGPVGEPPSCDEDIRATAESAERCGLIKEPNGPFAVCHDAVDPQRFFDSCVFDMCARNGDMVGLCEDFETYADACVDAGVHSFFWRTHSLCPGQCPPNSRYSSCTSFCPATCARDAANDCDRGHDCVEGCECNPGFILSGQSCVPEDQCGCTHSDGRYFALGERFGEDGKNCVCAKGNDITCEASGCDEDGGCDDVDICQTVDCGQKRECRETPGGYECACKKPFKEVEGSCRGFFTYSVVTRLLANEFYDELYDSNSDEFKNLVKEVRNAVKDLYAKGELTKNEFLDMDIREFVPGSIIAHYQLYLLDDSPLVREAGDDVPYILQETLKKLAKAHNGTHLMIEHEEGHQVSDHDECASPVDNDCSPFATCRNMVGYFKCACLDGYEDRSAEFEDPPGRVCQKCMIVFFNSL